MSRLLVSVRSAAEAEAALEGGAEVIDVKDPARGPLGRADLGVLREVIAAVAGRAPVSAALGELIEWGGRDPAEYPLPEGTAFVKVGLSACDRRDWKPLLADLRARVEAHASAPLQLPKWIAVAYADQAWARSPAPLEVLRFAEANGFAGLLLDTWEKNENRLTDWIIREELERLVAQTQWAGMTVALAGSLREEEIRAMADLGPDLFAVRGAVCRGGERDGEVSARAVRRLKSLLHDGATPTVGEAPPAG